MTGNRKTRKRRLIVTLSKERPVAEVETDLASIGFEVDESLGEIGVIVGRGAEADLQRIRAMRGVADVESESAVDIGPPESDESW